MENVKDKGKTRFYILLCCAGAAVLTLGILIGVLLSKRQIQSEKIEGGEPTGVQTAQNPTLTEADGKIAPSVYSEYVLRSAFTHCGHTVEEMVSGTGFTKEELLALYPDCQMTLHETGKPLVTRKIEAYCPQHYVLQMRENDIQVEQYDLSSGTQKIVSRINADPNSMPESIRAEILKGLAFENLSQIDEYIENAES